MDEDGFLSMGLERRGFSPAIVDAYVRSTLECGVEPPHSKVLRTAILIRRVNTVEGRGGPQDGRNV
jgi:hypothetical protein